MSGIYHVWQDHSNEWLCSMCGREIAVARMDKSTALSAKKDMCLVSRENNFAIVMGVPDWKN